MNIGFLNRRKWLDDNIVVAKSGNVVNEYRRKDIYTKEDLDECYQSSGHLSGIKDDNAFKNIVHKRQNTG